MASRFLQFVGSDPFKLRSLASIALLGLLGLFGLSWTASTSAQTAPPMTTTTPLRDGSHDFDALFGSWRVQHRTMKKDKSGWVEYAGTMSTRPTMGGAGNLEDNVLHPPSGTYRAMAVRAYDAATGLWAIWWIDGRAPHGPLDPPVQGRFENGVGQFYADDVWEGKPRRTRYTWSGITANAAHWAQAISLDGGQTWETNWEMQFSRAE